MVLATFIGRDFIKISELIKLIQDQEFEYFNIKKLVTSCNDFSSLPKDMLEKLLQFIEL